MSFETDFKEFLTTVNLYRSAQIRKVKGRPVQDQAQRYTQYTFKACIQPALDKKMNQDSVSAKLDRDLVGDIDLYSSLNLIIRSPENTEQSGDRVIYKNKVYELITSAPWEYFGTTINKYTACYISEKASDVIADSVPAETNDPNITPEIDDCFLEALIKG